MNRKQIELALKVFVIIAGFGMAGVALGYTTAYLTDNDRNSSIIEAPTEERVALLDRE